MSIRPQVIPATGQSGLKVKSATHAGHRSKCLWLTGDSADVRGAIPGWESAWMYGVHHRIQWNLFDHKRNLKKRFLDESTKIITTHIYTDNLFVHWLIFPLVIWQYFFRERLLLISWVCCYFIHYIFKEYLSNHSINRPVPGKVWHRQHGAD